MSKIVTGAAIGVAAAALAVGGIGIANADDTVTPNATSSNGSTAESGTPGWAADGQDGTGRPGGPGMGEEALTGETADKVTAAAQAELPNATIERVETDADGVYEAHAVKADGTHVIVQIDENFQVTAVVEMPAPGQGGPGTGPGGPGPGETLLEGDTAAKVTAAAQAELPNATIERVETDADGVYEAHAIKADGTHVVVKVDADFQVTGVEEMPAPGDGMGPGGHHGPGGTLPDGTTPDATAPDATTSGTTSGTSTTASLTA